MNKLLINVFILMLGFYLIACYKVVGQDNEAEQYAMPNTEVKHLLSKTNQVDYKLYVSYPRSYQDSTTKKYPVLYLLDADYSFAIAKNITDHLSERNHLQEMIIVGIAYGGPSQYRINRTRDYTPWQSEEDVPFREIQKTYSGGGTTFLKFLSDELLPFMDKNFRTNGFKALCGHSYGGLFSTWVLLTRPSLFNGYIVVSPSLWYANGSIFNADEKLSALKEGKLRAYFSAGARENQVMPADLKKLVAYLNNGRSKHLAFSHDIGSNETHNSIFPFAISNGIRYVFEGF